MLVPLLLWRGRPSLWIHLTGSIIRSDRLNPLCSPSRSLERIGIVARFPDNLSFTELQDHGYIVDAPTIVGACLYHPDISTAHNPTHGGLWWWPRVGILHGL